MVMAISSLFRPSSTKLLQFTKIGVQIPKLATDFANLPTGGFRTRQSGSIVRRLAGSTFTIGKPLMASKSSLSFSISEIESLMSRLAKEPVYYEDFQDCEKILEAKITKLPAGFETLMELVPEFLQESPVALGKTFSTTSTSARMVFEVDLDGSIAIASVFCGYFSTAYGYRHELPLGKRGLLKVETGHLKDHLEDIAGTATTIGAGLIAISDYSLEHWVMDKAGQRAHEDVVSLLLHFRRALVPFGTILIISESGYSCLDGRVDLQRACRESGVSLVKKSDSGSLRLDWMPAVPREQKPLSWSSPAFAEFYQGLEQTKLRASFVNILEKTPQKALALSSRLAAAKRGKSLIATNYLGKARQQLSLLRTRSSPTSDRNFQEGMRHLLNQECSADLDLDEDTTGSSVGLSS